MTAPSTGRDDATLRGAVVLVVAIVIGLALLARSGGGGSDEAATTTTVGATVSSTAVDGSTTTTADSVPGPINSSSTTSTTEGPADTRPPEEVTVIILNGTTANVDGIAGDNDEKVKAGGFTTLTATGASIDVPTTTIYADPEFAADAEAVKAVLGLPDAVIEPKPAESPGAGADQADVVVVIGDDAAG